jgi:RNA polymerase sigma-70 factor (ECF subfamily)
MSLDAESVYRRHAEELTRFATGLVGPWEAADVVSEAMIRCLRTPGWSDVVDQKGYLYRAVFNQAHQLSRTRIRRAARELIFYRSRATPTEFELRPEVWKAVRQLSVRQRAVIALTYWDDLTPAQIADRLGLTEGSVRRHLARARVHLRRVLTDD